MKFNSANRGTGWLGRVLCGIGQPGQSEEATRWTIARTTRQGLALVLSVLMIMIPMGQSDAFAQSAPSQAYPGMDQPAPPYADNAQQPSQGQPLSPDQLDQLVAPMALYPDELIAQVLAASTYPTQVVEANRWLKAQGNAPAAQIAAGANSQEWDASVKALTAFPQVLEQMDRNIRWTTDLGNAYYNQPQDVMDAVQAMRLKAQGAGQLRSTPQQTVTNDGGQIEIAPANPAVVYVPVYDPWAVWGSPFPPYPGFYYYPPAGIFWGGLAIGFGIGIGIGLFSHWGWGWGHWGMGWGSHSLLFNHGGYFTHSTTVINRGFNRPGGPGRGFGARGAYARPGGGFNRAGGGFNRAGGANRGAFGAGRSGANFGRAGTANRGAFGTSRSAGSFGRAGTANRSAFGASRSAGNLGRAGAARGFSGGAARASRSSVSHGGGGGGHFSGGHSGGGGHVGGGHSSGGHSGGGGHKR